ncbi:klaroid protein-like [Hylaeus anthracinus]|uniref:klaroid protein-like n=1 Tax=Hylaeus anthracinus TaxID=313031 RepID=UPI0023B97A0A|nr:klaroid protein-like [Hylaeus anthracinus]
MENEQHHYELRSGSRSRSQTPLVHSRALLEPEIPEHHYVSQNQSRERSRTPAESTSSKQSGSRSLPGSSSKLIMDTILESSQDYVDNQSNKSETSSTSTRKVERRSERQKAKREIYANGQNENKDNSSTRKTERKHKSGPSERLLTSDYSSEEGEHEDLHNRLDTHEIYTKAGDWWNVFPKTDYTYAQTSTCRYEVAPGILAIPNMSRRSIHSSDTSNCLSQSESGICLPTSLEEDTELSAQNRTTKVTDESLTLLSGTRVSNFDAKSRAQFTKKHVEQYHSHREVVYGIPESSTNVRRRQIFGSNALETIDSDTELEDAVSISSKYTQSRKIAQFFTTTTSTIILWFNKLLEFLKLKTVRRREYDRYATYKYQRYAPTWYSKLWQYISHTMDYIYICMVKLFFFDSWLLSRLSGVRKWAEQKGCTVLWIALLPLLLLTGCWYLSTSSPSMKFATRQIREVSDLYTVDKVSFRTEDDFKSIKDRLEDRITDQTTKVLLLEKELEKYKLGDMHVHEIETIKLQVQTLKELYSELKSCCNTNTNRINNEDLGKRIETIVAEYFGSLVSKENWITTETRNDNVTSDDRVHEIVKNALRIYDADKTGRVDYALETAGGQIISTRCTQKYDIKTRAFKVLAFTLYHENNNPRTVIQGNPIQPGACWAFQGFPGYLLIKLRSPIYVTGFTVEHAPKSILPNGEMRSAPRKFNVWGFVDENDPVPVMFGDYEFAASDESLQYFPVQNTTIENPYEYVELRVHSNHGQLEYTCLYRFRVHGKPFLH